MDEPIAKIKSRPGETGNPYHTYNMRDIDDKYNKYHLQIMLNKCIMKLSNQMQVVCNTHDRRVLQVFENRIDGNRETVQS